MGNKLTIIVDGNNHFHKSLYVTPKQSKGRMLGTQRDKEMYIRKLAMDLAFAIRMFGAPDRIVFTMDGFSWRKNIDMLEQNDGYKANRVRDDSAVDWDAFNEVNRDFFDILSTKGFISSNLKTCEGDDLMYFWAKKYFEAGEDVVIFSGDGDITQLVKFNNKNFVCVFNTKSTSRQIIGAPGFGKWIEKKMELPDNILDMFLNDDLVPDSCEIINKVIASTKLVEVNPEDVLYEKIVSGDGGDNVPPIVSWETTQKSGKIITNKISGQKAAKIKEMIYKLGDVDVTNLQNYAKHFKRAIKEVYDKDFDEQLLHDRLKRNTTLVLLSDTTIPSDIQNQFEDHYINYINHGAPKLQKMDMGALLEGSKWWAEARGFDADVFSGAKPTNIKETPTPRKNLLSVTEELALIKNQMSGIAQDDDTQIESPKQKTKSLF